MFSTGQELWFHRILSELARDFSSLSRMKHDGLS